MIEPQLQTFSISQDAHVTRAKERSNKVETRENRDEMSRARQVALWLMDTLPVMIRSRYLDSETQSYSFTLERAENDPLLTFAEEIIPPLTEIFSGRWRKESWDKVVRAFRSQGFQKDVVLFSKDLQKLSIDEESFDSLVSLYFHDIYSHGLGSVIASLPYIQESLAAGEKEYSEELIQNCGAELESVVNNSIQVLEEVNQDQVQITVSQVTKALMRFLSPLANKYNLRLEVAPLQSKNSLERKVSLSRYKLYSYIQNFFSNSNKAYGERGGPVRVAIAVSPPENPQQLVLSFSDKAGGFPDHQETLSAQQDTVIPFNPQSGRSSWKHRPEDSASKQGLGVSLAAIKKQIELAGGSLFASTQVNGELRGATITISLPLN